MRQGNRLHRAVFLDRDGTLIEDRGHLRDPSEVVFFPDTVRALRKLQGDFRLFIVTNQRGVADGILTLAQVERVNGHVVQYLADAGVAVRDVYVCPHRRADNCVCIKPKTHLLDLAAREHGLDLRASYAIGDHPHDVELAHNAGGRGVYVLTGHGAKHRAELPAGACVAAGIAEAGQMIASRCVPRAISAIRGPR